MAESAGEEVVAVGEWLVGPAGSMSDGVMETAERVEVFRPSGPASLVFEPVVQVGVDGRGATAGVDAGGVESFDLASLSGGWSTAGDAVAERLAGFGVFDGVAPLSGALLFGDLAGEVGDGRSASN